MCLPKRYVEFHLKESPKKEEKEKKEEEKQEKKEEDRYIYVQNGARFYKESLPSHTLRPSANALSPYSLYLISFHHIFLVKQDDTPTLNHGCSAIYLCSFF